MHNSTRLEVSSMGDLTKSKIGKLAQTIDCKESDLIWYIELLANEILQNSQEDEILSLNRGNTVDFMAMHIGKLNKKFNKFCSTLLDDPKALSIMGDALSTSNKKHQEDEPKADLVYITYGLFTAFHPITNEGHKAWNELAMQTDMTGKVLTCQLEPVLEMLRLNGYIVEPSRQTQLTTNEVLQQLEL